MIDPMPPRIGDLNMIHTKQGMFGLSALRTPDIFPGGFGIDLRMVQYVLNTEIPKLEKWHQFDEHHAVFKFKVPGRPPETRYGLDVEFNQHLKLTLLVDLNEETFDGDHVGMLFIPFYENNKNINFNEVEDTLTPDSYFVIKSSEAVENIFEMMFYFIRMREIIIRQQIGVRGEIL